LILGSVGWEGKVANHVRANNYAHVLDYEKFREEKLKEIRYLQKKLEIN